MPTLSRTYRPHFFADVTGQGPITETLRLEIATNKIGHSYLFSGSRGIGKTTVARIFAQALNCLARKEGEPCGICEACLEFQTGRSLDIIEMDAASNTGVDNIREAIVEHVRFAPSSRKYKVYILDEAHMLSTSAWNALLKTIEEPPEYAVFLFLTTELHKVPATIQSRSQRFDFHRITNQDLTKRLQEILLQEKSR
jgi:DNA polymerase III subunit gamma/tau